MSEKFVYFFGEGQSDGDATQKNLLGGKGANLAEMARLGIPVPPGFTLTTEVCTYYYDNEHQFPASIEEEVNAALAKVEQQLGQKFGDPSNPLLLSVRSGARQSMPGMMETILNLGLTSETLPGLIEKTEDARFVWDSYRRLMTMYSDVVMEKAAGISPPDGQGIRMQLERLLERTKRDKGYTSDVELTAEDWEALCAAYRERIEIVLGQPFPDNAHEQLWGGIRAVFRSWNGKRAKAYRQIEGIPEEWGTAVNVQAMVFGNLGDNSATGVAFTRSPATGENLFYGEWLKNAQGEDVVAGIRTPHPLNLATMTEGVEDICLETEMPGPYKQLAEIRTRLEQHYGDMQDVEFTIQNGKLWMLQTRTGKRNGIAAVTMAVEMVQEGMISREEALLRVSPDQLDEWLHSRLDVNHERKAAILTKGLPAGPGGATGQIVLSADKAEAWAAEGKVCVLVREETSPEDVHGMHAATAILTARGGMTSHAALVARGWGKCCVVGCQDLEFDEENLSVKIGDQVFQEGDWVSLNGSKGTVYAGHMQLEEAHPESNPAYATLMEWADEFRRLEVLTNADSPEDAARARSFGAQGIGLCRTEHMFFEPERILAVRRMILSDSEAERRAALDELLPFQQQDFEALLETMEGKSVTIRLLDPPFHEFMTLNAEQMAELSEASGHSIEFIEHRIEQLHETNPMLGQRGCRLGVAYPEIVEMQARAIFEATSNLVARGVDVHTEVMIPLVSDVNEFGNQEAVVRRVAQEIQQRTGQEFSYHVGTMLELPRACLTADRIASKAEFFSFGTNDLTQTTFGFSRDDVGGFLPYYLSGKLLPADPFQKLDVEGVGQLIQMATEKGRSVRPGIRIGICGEHGGEPSSIEFCHRTGLDYVSCSPFRVPVARLAAAHAAIRYAN